MKRFVLINFCLCFRHLKSIGGLKWEKAEYYLDFHARAKGPQWEKILACIEELKLKHPEQASE